MLKTVSSIVNAIGALNYKGTWNASTNTPALASGAGTKGDYYQVSVAGSTNLDGISNWGVGDVAAFNGTTWQRIEGGADLNGVNLSVSGTSTLSALTASTALALNGSKEVVSVTNTGTGNNVLATSPTIATPTLQQTISNTFTLTGAFAGGYTTAVDLTTVGDRLLVRAAGNEFSYNNASDGLWLALRDTGTATYTLVLISQAAHGNGHGTVNLQMSGNNLQIKNANSSGIGAWGLHFTKLS